MLTLIINIINKTAWISFIIFILYIGGLIIIFLYISRIAFNEFNINKNYKNILIKSIFLTIFILYFKLYFNIENFFYENKLLFEDNFNLINIFIIPNNLIIYLIIIILFFILILIIWILKINKGPIRQKK